MRSNRGLVVALTLTATLLLGSCASGSNGADRAGPTTLPGAPIAQLYYLHATHGEGAAIVDSQDRQVLLRGVNVNSLGDYYQANAELPPVVGVADTDWTAMESHGFNVVRLLVSWSRLEPNRGEWDQDYIDQIQVAVESAAAHGMYTVIDMHQDAWGKYIASPAGVSCPAGLEPAIGWDGAPEWATLSGGPEGGRATAEQTCRGGTREASEAVLYAWDNFYADTTGIMDELVATWGHLASRFAADANVAGYDLLNEPNHGHDNDRAKVQLGVFYGKAIDAIRRAETDAASRGTPQHHIVFFEPTFAGVAVDPGFSTDTNIVFAPHNYGESIGDIPLGSMFDLASTLAGNYGTPFWTGEYGWFRDTPDNASKVQRYAAKEDATISAGDAWWQWRQACGDPHSIHTPGGTPEGAQIHLQRNTCPGDVNEGVIDTWHCVWRAYPQATPGRLDTLNAECDGALSFSGTTDAAGTARIWVPDRGQPGPVATGTGTSDASTVPVVGGWQVMLTVTGSYSVRIAAGP